MSKIKRCPTCGSMDVRPAYLNYVGRGAKSTAAWLVGFGAGMLMGGGSHGTHTAQHITEELSPKGELKKYHCDTCGHEW